VNSGTVSPKEKKQEVSLSTQRLIQCKPSDQAVQPAKHAKHEYQGAASHQVKVLAFQIPADGIPVQQALEALQQLEGGGYRGAVIKSLGMSVHGNHSQTHQGKAINSSAIQTAVWEVRRQGCRLRPACFVDPNSHRFSAQGYNRR
jgi:hypothetical protein